MASFNHFVIADLQLPYHNSNDKEGLEQVFWRSINQQLPSELQVDQSDHGTTYLMWNHHNNALNH